MVGGERPIPREILCQNDLPLQKRRLPLDIRSYSASAVSTKFNYYYTGYPVSLR